MAGRIIIDDGNRLLDNNGNPISGGKLRAYVAGTSTPATLYTTSELATAHTDPVVADSSGFLPQMWAADLSAYDVKTYAANDTSYTTPLQEYLDVSPLPLSLSTSLAEARTYYVRTDGSDSNGGLTNTSGGAFLTIQAAINAAFALNLGGNVVTIQVADGTYAGAISINGRPLGGYAEQFLRIIGNESNPENVVISVSGNCLTTGNQAYVYLAGLTFVSTGKGWFIDGESVVEHQNCRFGDCTQEMILTLGGSRVRALGTTTIVGDAQYFIHATKRSLVDFGSRTIVYTGNPTFSVYLFGLNDSSLHLDSATITNTATGPILVHKNAFMNVSSLTGNYLGGTAPVVQDGGYIAVADKMQNALFYVRPDGSDQNDGLANTAGRAWLTLGGAISNLQLLPPDPVTVGAGGGIRSCTLNVAAGTYTGNVTLKDLPAFNYVNILGDETTPANVHINVTGDAFTADSISTRYHVRGFRITASSYCIRAEQGSHVLYRNCAFGTASAHIVAETGASVEATGNYSITGAASYHIIQRYGSIVDIPNAVVTITGTPAFTVFHYNKSGFARWAGSSFSGSATGTRYEVLLNGVIDTNGGGASFLPGNAAGSSATGGQYA